MCPYYDHSVVPLTDPSVEVPLTHNNARRTDRVEVAVPIEVSGSDAAGQYFFDRTETLVVSRHGATFVLDRKLMPEQTLVIRNLANQREAEVNVIGFVAKHAKGDVYGAKFVDGALSVWDIDFPPIEEARDAAYHLVLECLGCGTRRVSYLDQLDSEVFRASGALRRKCEKCRDSMLWKESSGPIPVEEPPATTQPQAPVYVEASEPLVSAHAWDGAVQNEDAPPPPRPKGINDRKHVRSKMQVPACVRRLRGGSEDWGTQEEVELTDDCSRGGFAFQSYARFKVGDEVEAAVPYKPGGANIFVPARIANARKQKDGRYRYGVEYVRRGYR